MLTACDAGDFGNKEYSRAYVEGVIDEIRAAAAKLPATHVMVPVEPTDAMLRPFYDCPPDELKLAWQAMLHIVNVQNIRAAKEGK
jgi:hypothetical protein